MYTTCSHICQVMKSPRLSRAWHLASHAFGVWLAKPVTSQFWRAYKLNEYLAKICMSL